jgi:hypothetical protein
MGDVDTSRVLEYMDHDHHDHDARVCGVVWGM